MVSNPKEFVQNLKVKYPKYKLEGLDSKSALESAVEGGNSQQPEAYINNKSLTSFAANVSGQNRQDLLNSTLLAQLVADYCHPESFNIKLWYLKYVDVLKNIGWTLSAKEFATFETSGSVFEMDAAVLQILSAAIGGGYLNILTQTIDSFKSLSDSDNKIKAFEKNTHNLNKGTFQLALAVEDNGIVSLSLGAFQLSTSEEIKQIVFFKSSKDNTEMKYLTDTATLNNDVFSLVRNDIQAKLGNKAQSFISKLPDFA